MSMQHHQKYGKRAFKVIFINFDCITFYDFVVNRNEEYRFYRNAPPSDVTFMEMIEQIEYE